MPYNFDFAVSADITPDVIVEMITKVVEEQTGRKVDRVELKLGKVNKGDNYRESWTETVFEGAKVYFSNTSLPEIKPKPTAPFLKR